MSHFCELPPQHAIQTVAKSSHRAYKWDSRHNSGRKQGGCHDTTTRGRAHWEDFQTRFNSDAGECGTAGGAHVYSGLYLPKTDTTLAYTTVLAFTPHVKSKWA
jgi:hypothetical protein